jgi:hypothetical protein
MKTGLQDIAPSRPGTASGAVVATGSPPPAVEPVVPPVVPGVTPVPPVPGVVGGVHCLAASHETGEAVPSIVTFVFLPLEKS